MKPTVCGQVEAASFSAAMYASMSGTRTLSKTIQGDGIRLSRTDTSRMWPVRPIPPTVARNRSRSFVGEQSTDPTVRDAEPQ